MSGKFSNEVVLKNILDIKSKIAVAAVKSGRKPEEVTLLAATKTVDADTINFAIRNGITCIGENRVQELLQKYDDIIKDGVDFHFIGRLQTNKVKYIMDKVKMIHSLDSLKLAAEIDRQCKKIGKIMNVLVEVNIANEPSKGGICAEELENFLREISAFENIKVIGLMCIPPVTDNSVFEPENENGCGKNGEKNENTKKSYKNQAFFKKIMQLFLDISHKNIDNIYMQVLSMGMSDDFETAVEEGSTVVRIGRELFGDRI